MEQRISLSNKNKSLGLFILKNFFLDYSNHIDPLIFLKNYIDFLVWKTKTQCRQKKSDILYNCLYLVPPNEISLCTLKELNQFKYDSFILNGNWDISNKRFEDLDIYISFKKHFIYNINWQETIYFKNILKKFKENKISKGCRDEKAFLKVCQKFDRLFLEIRKNGYKTQKMLNNKFIGKKLIDEVSVNLSRNSKFLFNNGAHRLAIAKILNIDEIPVRITAYHKMTTDSKFFKNKAQEKLSHYYKLKL